MPNNKILSVLEEDDNLIKYDKDFSQLSKDYTLIFYGKNNEIIYEVGIGNDIFNINKAIDNYDNRYLEYLLVEPLMKNNIMINELMLSKILTHETNDKYYDIYCCRELLKKLPCNIISNNIEHIMKYVLSSDVINEYYKESIYIIAYLLSNFNSIKHKIIKYIQLYLSKNIDLLDCFNKLFDLNIDTNNNINTNNEITNKNIRRINEIRTLFYFKFI